MHHKGKTNVQIFTIIGVSESTFQRWLSILPDFREELQEQKNTFGKELVETSLISRCKGATLKERRVKKDKDGNVIEILEIDREIPPETGAIKLFLENRYPDRYNAKQIEINIQNSLQTQEFHGMTLRELQEFNEKHSLLDQPIPDEESC